MGAVAAMCTVDKALAGRVLGIHQLVNNYNRRPFFNLKLRPAPAPLH